MRLQEREKKMPKRMYTHRKYRHENNSAHHYRELRKLVLLCLGSGGNYVPPEKLKNQDHRGSLSGLKSNFEPSFSLRTSILRN